MVNRWPVNRALQKCLFFALSAFDSLFRGRLSEDAMRCDASISIVKASTVTVDAPRAHGSVGDLHECSLA